jgi:hypothetical protein
MLSHVAIALLIQVAVKKGLGTSWWAGAAASASWAVAREITQAEYRWIEEFGGGIRANMPWWGGFDRRVWHADAMLDWLLPTLTAFAVARYFEGGRTSRRMSAN